MKAHQIWADLGAYTFDAKLTFHKDSVDQNLAPSWVNSTFFGALMMQLIAPNKKIRYHFMK